MTRDRQGFKIPRTFSLPPGYSQNSQQPTDRTSFFSLNENTWRDWVRNCARQKKIHFTATATGNSLSYSLVNSLPPFTSYPSLSSSFGFTPPSLPHTPLSALVLVSDGLAVLKQWLLMTDANIILPWDSHDTAMASQEICFIHIWWQERKLPR